MGSSSPGLKKKILENTTQKIIEDQVFFKQPYPNFTSTVCDMLSGQNEPKWPAEVKSVS